LNFVEGITKTFFDLFSPDTVYFTMLVKMFTIGWHHGKSRGLRNSKVLTLYDIQLSVIFLRISFFSFFLFFSFFFFPVMLYYSYTLMFSLFYSIVATLLCVVLFAPW